MAETPHVPGEKPKKVVHLKVLDGKRGEGALSLLKDLVEAIEKGNVEVGGIVLASFVTHEGQQCFHIDAAGVDAMNAVYLLERAKHEVLQGEVYGFEEE